MIIKKILTITDLIKLFLYIRNNRNILVIIIKNTNIIKLSINSSLKIATALTCVALFLSFNKYKFK